MLTAHFTGRVLPTALNVSIANEPTFNWKADELGLEMRFRVRIRDGSISIDCDLNKFESTYIVPLFMRAYDIARTCVDLAAFTTGSGLAMILEEFTDPTGIKTQLAAQQPSLAALASAVRPGTEDFEKILGFVLAEPALFMALRDLIEAITVPHRAAVNCARAMKTLGRAFRTSSGSADRGWLALRDNLQISKSYVQKIMQDSSNPRDGDHAQISGAKALDV